MILHLLAIGLQMPKDDPTFALVKQLVGGRWEGKSGPVKVTFRYALEQEGAMIGATGMIDDGKNPKVVRVSFGWDPTAKQVYYLDQHGSDTVYFGHVTRKGSVLAFDFKGLSGDTGHYRFETTVGKDDSSSTMSMEQDGKLADLGLHVTMKRVR